MSRFLRIEFARAMRAVTRGPCANLEFDERVSGAGRRGRTRRSAPTPTPIYLIASSNELLRRRGEEPVVAFEVAGPVAAAVRLVRRLVDDLGAGGLRPGEMRIDIVDVD